MLASSRPQVFRLIVAAFIAALTLVGATLAPADTAAGSIGPTARPSALTADRVIEQITGEDGVLRFDVAEDGTRFVRADQPVFDGRLPAHGATYLSQGYICPAGTLGDDVDGVNADGSPEFPDKVLGQWSCYGWYIGDGAHATTEPWVLSTQLYNFGGERGKATLVSEGYVMSDVGGGVLRAITGGTGPYAVVRGELLDTNLGLNETEGAKARYDVRLAP